MKILTTTCLALTSSMFGTGAFAGNSLVAPAPAVTAATQSVTPGHNAQVEHRRYFSDQDHVVKEMNRNDVNSSSSLANVRPLVRTKPRVVYSQAPSTAFYDAAVYRAYWYPSITIRI